MASDQSPETALRYTSPVRRSRSAGTSAAGRLCRLHSPPPLTQALSPTERRGRRCPEGRATQATPSQRSTGELLSPSACRDHGGPALQKKNDSGADRHGVTIDALEREVHRLSERLANAENERNWAIAALRESEQELQQLLAAHSASAASVRREMVTAPVHHGDVQHYRMLVELLSGRCQQLEGLLEDEVCCAAARDTEKFEALSALEEETAQLGAAMVEQQRAFKERLEAMRLAQEELVKRHTEELKKGAAYWAQEREALSSCAAADIAALQEDFRQREAQWLQEWASLQRSEVASQAVPTNSGVPVPRATSGFSELASIPEAPEGCDATPPLALQPRNVEVPQLPAQGAREEVVLSRSASDSPTRTTSGQERVSLREPSAAVGDFLSSSSPLNSARACADNAHGGVSGVSDATASFALGPESPPREESAEHSRHTAGASWRTHGAGVPGLLAAGLPRGGHVPAQQVPVPSREVATSASDTPSSPQFGAPQHGGVLGPSANTVCVALTAQGTDALKCADSINDQPFGIDAADRRQAARAWARLGQAEQRARRFEEARAAYRKAAQLDDSQHGILANLAQIEAHAGNFTMACDLLDAALKLDPTNAVYTDFRRWLQSGRRNAS